MMLALTEIKEILNLKSVLILLRKMFNNDLFPMTKRNHNQVIIHPSTKNLSRNAMTFSSTIKMRQKCQNHSNVTMFFHS